MSALAASSLSGPGHLRSDNAAWRTPSRPTMAIARLPTIFTGSSSVCTWQAACASIGSAKARVASAPALRYRRIGGRGLDIGRICAIDSLC